MLASVSLTVGVDQGLSRALTSRASALGVHPEALHRRALSAFLLAPTAHHPGAAGGWPADVDTEFYQHLPLEGEY